MYKTKGIRIAIILFLVVFGLACKKSEIKDDELSIQRVPYVGNQVVVGLAFLPMFVLEKY